MIISCPCGSTISLPAWQFFSATGAELNYLCLQYDYSISSGNPWFDAVLTKGEVKGNEEYVEEEDTDEQQDLDNPVIEYDEDNLEGHDELPEYYDEQNQD